MDKAKIREVTSRIKIENIIHGYDVCKSEPFSFAAALHLHKIDGVFQLFDEGKSNAEVSARLSIPMRTVQDYRKRYFKSNKKKPGK